MLSLSSPSGAKGTRRLSVFSGMTEKSLKRSHCVDDISRLKTSELEKDLLERAQFARDGEELSGVENTGGVDFFLVLDQLLELFFGIKVAQEGCVPDPEAIGLPLEVLHSQANHHGNQKEVRIEDRLPVVGSDQGEKEHFLAVDQVRRGIECNAESFSPFADLFIEGCDLVQGEKDLRWPAGKVPVT